MTVILGDSNRVPHTLYKVLPLFLCFSAYDNLSSGVISQCSFASDKTTTADANYLWCNPIPHLQVSCHVHWHTFLYTSKYIGKNSQSQKWKVSIIDLITSLTWLLLYLWTLLNFVIFIKKRNECELIKRKINLELHTDCHYNTYPSKIKKLQCILQSRLWWYTIFLGSMTTIRIFTRY